MRVLVSSPWMPPVCAHCKEVGHSVKRCKKAPITCTACKSSTHTDSQCPRGKVRTSKRQSNRKKWVEIPVSKANSSAVEKLSGSIKPHANSEQNLGNPLKHGLLIGDSSGLSIQSKSYAADSDQSSEGKALTSEAEEDSSDISSSEPEDDPTLKEE